MLNYIAGLVIGIIACGVYVAIYKLYLGPLMQWENGLTKIHDSAGLVKKWSGARYVLTLLFGHGGFFMAMGITELIGWYIPRGLVGLFAFLIFALAWVGWYFCSWWLARLCLKKFAPKIYTAYSPYYSENLRQKIRAVMSA